MASDGINAQQVRALRKLARGRVWCLRCGRTFQVETSACIAKGWPTCCAEIMTIDAPSERDEAYHAGKEDA